MNLEKWDKEDIIKYHTYSKRGYAGDISSTEIIRLSKKYIGKKILDVGAGSGALIDKLPNAIGIDLVPKHPKIIKGDISNMGFHDKSFDTIFATDVFEHLDNDTLIKCLDEIYRILMVSGRLIITVPYKEDLKQNMALCPKCGAKFHKVGHMQVFDEKRITKMLLDKGFDITRIDILPIGFMATHKFLKYFRKILDQLGFLKSNNLYLVVGKK